MTHEQIREMLSAEERTADVEAHLARCKACARWDATLQRIRGAAPSAFAEAPSGLADRVAVGVRAAVAVAPAVVAAAAARPADVTPLWRRVGARAAVATAVAAAVAATAIVAPNVGGDEEPALVAAAARTTAAKTARVEMKASFSFVPDEPITLPTPDLGDLGARLRASLPPELAELGARLPEAPRLRIAPIRAITSSISASGAVVFPDRLHLRGTTTQSHGGERTKGSFETIAIGGKTWVRTPVLGERWVRLPDFPVSIRFDVAPGRLIGDVRDFRGDPSYVGEEDLDGERVHHWRFSDRTSFGEHLGERDARIDAYVGVDDGLLRMLESRHDAPGPGGRVKARTSVRLHDFGADVSVEAPSAEDEATLDELAAGFLGFGFGFAGGAFIYSFEAAAHMPSFAFPQLGWPDVRFELPDLPDLPKIEMPDIEVRPFPTPTFRFEGEGSWEWQEPDPSATPNE